MSGPDPAVAAARTRVRRALADLPDGALVLVACSGGVDSLALATTVAFLAPRLGLRAGAVVVDHGLQAGTDQVAAQAADRCRGLGLDPVDVVAVVVDGPGGPEAAARDARYTALGDVARRTGAAAVLLGHTRDDQAENVLLGLARGSGARSLAGMPRTRGLLRRPLLDLTRAQTTRVCQVHGLDPWVDPTDHPGADAPLRSQVRHRVLPLLEQVLGPGAAAALARTAEQLREDADALDHLATATLEQVTGERSAGRVDLDAVALAQSPTALRRRALRQACVQVGLPAGALHRAHVVAVDALVVAWHGQGAVALPGGGGAYRRCGRLTVAGPQAGGRQSDREQ